MTPPRRVPKEVQRAIEVLLRWCSVYDVEGDQARFLDLHKSPARIARMWRDELLASYQPGALRRLCAKFTTFKLRPGQHQEMIVQRNITFSSVCAHHMLPFFGTVAIGYIPDACIVGLSKMSRVVDFYSRQMQLQERMTSQIADFLEAMLKPRAIVVAVRAEHHCMALRGVQRAGTVTLTSAVRGLAATQPDVKQEFYDLLR